ncbi:hypothetical protein Tco_0540701 [Tanacetum coccineum]
MMGELKFFLGIQIHLSPHGIFINQATYAQEILKKHDMTSCDSVGTPMATKPLHADLSGTLVDQTKYRSMVEALMYLIASRPDIVHATCYYARYQARPTEKHLKEIQIMQAVSIHVKAHLVLADMFTKALPEDRFKYLVRRLCMRCLTPEELEVMAISVISISSDSSEESVGTSTARVILFGMIPTTISATVPIVDPPVVHDDTPLILTATLTILLVVSTLPHTSPFLYTDSSDSDTFERPPLQDSYEATVAQWRSRVAVRSSPSSSPTHDSSPTDTSRFLLFDLTVPSLVRKMLTVRKRVRVLPLGHLASRYPPNHSSSDHFSLDDSSSDSSSYSSSNYSLDSSSGHSLPDSFVEALVTIFVRPSRKRCRSPAISVSLATPVPGALSPVRADLIPPYIIIDISVAEATTTRESDVIFEVGIGSDGEDEAEEEAESEDRGTIKIGVDKVIEHVVSDDVYESASDDMSESADERGLDALVQELHDHLMEIPVWRIRVIESV